MVELGPAVSKKDCPDNDDADEYFFKDLYSLGDAVPLIFIKRNVLHGNLLWFASPRFIESPFPSYKEY